ncbi:MAG: DUF5696 domain-containing protein [Candidatus Izemoplasmatales bacterium]
MFSIRLIKRATFIFTLLIVLSITFVLVKAQDDYVINDELPNRDNILDETYLASNQFTQEDDLTIVNNYLSIPSTYLKIAENSNYILYMEETSYAIRVLNKNDNFIYGSSLSTMDDNLDNFNTTWEGIVNSAVTIKYFDYNDDTGIFTTKEESLLKDPNSSSTYQLINQGYKASLHFGESNISLTLSVYLDDEYLVVDIENDSIEEKGIYKLRSIKVFPFLGTVYANSIPGYIMVPDGSGALIRYQDIGIHNEIYEFRYYGQDNSIQTALEYEAKLAFPVSGMIQGINQHGFISIIEDGAAHASLVVSPAKNNLKYYYSYNEFDYRSLYQTPLSESDSANRTGRLVIEDDINGCDLVMKYKFLSGNQANYVGMANAYRDYLINELNVEEKINEENVKVLIDIIGSETKEGFIFDEYLQMTRINEVQSIIKDLLESDINPLTVYKGYSSKGLTSMGMVTNGISSKLGSNQDIEDLLSYVDENNVDLFFQIDPLSVYEDAKFSLYSNATKRINQNFLIDQGFTKTKYYIEPNSVEQALLSSIENLEKNGLTNYALDSIGYFLFSHYPDVNSSIDRSKVISIYKNLLDSLNKKIIIYQANDYLLKYTNEYLLTPMNSSRYRIYSDTVPFVPYVLQGLMDKYSPYQNFNSASRVELLKMVDYAIAPTYLLTWASAYELQATELQQIYSSSYNTWKERIKSDYDFIYEGLNVVRSASVVSRTYLSAGIYEINYDNGVKLIINYTNRTYDYLGINVEALNYKVVSDDA